MTPRTWLPDPSHYPEQMTPLSATTWFEAVGTGLHRAMRQLRGPFAGFEARTELGWAYEGELDVEWEPEPVLLERAALDLGERWEREYRPRVHALTEEIHSLRPEQPPPAGAVDVLDRMWRLMLEQWTLHFLVVIPAQIAVEMLDERYGQANPDADALEAYRLLDAVPNDTTEADSALWDLAEEARRLHVADAITDFPPAAALERLRLLRQGRLWLAALDSYLERFGGRSRWHEVSLPREVELPEMTFESVRLFLESGRPPTLRHGEDAATIEREVLERAPAIGEVLPAAKAAYALKESHVHHIDYPGLLAVREVLLGFARRLVAEGRLSSIDDVWMLRREELRGAVADDWPTARLTELVEERRAELAKGLAEGPKEFLGEPPPEDPERHAALEKFYGRSGEAMAARLRGTGASRGVGEGPARVVRGPADFERVRPGDVLIATTTTPAWTPLFPSLAALVTETGGVLSHAAIVAREYGLPAVVGVPRATSVVSDGVRVRVDGATGDVALT